LGTIDQNKLVEQSKDPAFMAHYNRAIADFDAYMDAADTWYDKNFKNQKRPVLAYFSTEFGLTECLQNYSGGLGVLSGDHLKSASDLGLPLVGVGLLYQEGYFQQYLNADGYQQENYPVNDYANLPVTLQRDDDGKPIKISVPLPGRNLYAQIWKVQVGRVPLFLLDSNISDNPRLDDRNITDRLYGGDRRQRIRQEILMGIGGIRALEALNLRPDVCHMNEGHSAFLGLERIRILMQEKGVTFNQAREITKSGCLFTTHTPVPAGLERFGYDLIDEHFTEYWKTIGLDRQQFHDLGRESMGDYDLFSMPVLALKLSSDANGVAKLHGLVSRHMWQWMYPGVPEHEIPIDAVTNGVHMLTWTSREMSTLLDRYLNPAWRSDESNPEIWQDVDQIPDGELWRTHERRRERLVAFARGRLRDQLIKRGVPQSEVKEAEEVLNPDVLTIGFARRFATYKRATLLFEDLERLKRLLNDPERPVQLIFSGKAHPHDEAGKEFIRQIIKMTRDQDLRHSVVFLENYDMLIGRYLVQGVDVWLNNPRRPKEASGTSGMKVIYNGGLNCSILDGWWDEAYSPDVGWAIGSGEEYDTQHWEQQDNIESHSLYNVLEQDIIPLFYDRGRDGLPRGWIAKVKASMKKLAPYFTTRRMVQEYAEKYYIPAYDRIENMLTPDMEPALDYAAWRTGIEKAWTQVQVKKVQVPTQSIKVDTEVEVTAVVNLGKLTPEDVRVQLYCGHLETNGAIGPDGVGIDMQPVKSNGSGEYTFKGTVKYPTSGDRGLSVRVLPKHKYLATPFQPGLITWAK
jgi:glycogen phosphorylase